MLKALKNTRIMVYFAFGRQNLSAEMVSSRALGPCSILVQYQNHKERVHHFLRMILPRKLPGNQPRPHSGGHTMVCETWNIGVQ